MRKKAIMVIISTIIVTLSGYALFAQPIAQKSDDLWEHLQRRSKVWSKNYIKQNGGAMNEGQWKEPLNKIFMKLANASGNKPFEIVWSVIKSKSFNACAFPGGQFIINKGALEILDKKAHKNMKADGPKGKKRGINWYRERVIAPIIAHELSHYYNRHTYNSIKKNWALKDSKESISLNKVKFSQENEHDADVTGYLLIKRAGYDPKTMIDMLKFLNYIHQKGLKRGYSTSTFFATHPSPHSRIAKLAPKGQEFHKWAALMEKTFDNIQFNRNLPEALKTIEDALKKYKNNLHILKAYAVALHKSWLATVPLSKQKFKAIIDMPSFRDDMVIKSRASRSMVPGDSKLYYKAMEAYRKILKKTRDPLFLSNYGVLLCYSSMREDKKFGLGLTLKATKSLPVISTLVNYSIALYFNRKKNDAISLLYNISQKIDAKFSQTLDMAKKNSSTRSMIEKMQSYTRDCQLLDKEYVYSNFTPILNLALIFKYTGKTERAKAIAEEFISKYDSNSAWAEYLAKITGVSINIAGGKSTKKPLLIDGIKIGDTIDLVIKKWNKPNLISKDSRGYEVWKYYKKGINVMIEAGTVYYFDLLSNGSPKINNSFGVGSTRKNIENTLGKHKTVSGYYHLYSAGQKVAVIYTLGIADRIIVTPE